MYAIKSDWIFDIETRDMPWSEEIGVIDYNTRVLYTYSNVLLVVNEIYVRLIRKSIDNDLLNAIGDIVEKLNNLVHFEYTKDIKDESVLVNDYLGLFKTFEYRKLSSFKKETSIEVHKVQYISKDIIKQLEVNYRERFSRSMEDIRDNYKGYYIGDVCEEGVYPLISCRKERTIISIVPNVNNDEVLKGLLEVFRVVCSIDKEDLYLEEYYRFSMTRGKIHKEIVHLINRLLQALNYVFNSTSFRNNEYYVFDRFEVERRVDVDIEAWLSHTKALILTEIGYIIEKH